MSDRHEEWVKSTEEIDRLRAENARLTAERDEARRELCHAIADCVHKREEDEAEYRGWDCFTKEAKP